MNGLRSENAARRLTELFAGYGYKRYKMSKFESYELYLENKSFLRSEEVVTCTAPDGRLLALKPDITLSIAKNVDDGKTSKVFYSESVYRASREDGEIKEITQTGVERMGIIDAYATSEVVAMATEGLRLIDKDCIMGISHIGLTGGLAARSGIPAERQSEAMRCISEKNAHDLRRICTECKVDERKTDMLVKTATLYGTFEKTLDEAKTLADGDREMLDAIAELSELYCILDALGLGKYLRLDLSIMNDMSYYNGIIFQGFTAGVPKNILSGGRYDRLTEKFGKTCGAVGFAVFTDLLDLYGSDCHEYDVEAAVLYGDCDIPKLSVAVRELAKTLNGVTAISENDAESLSQIKYKKLYRFGTGGLEEIEKRD